MFFDVSFERDKGLVDEVCDGLVAIGLGFQPSAGASSGRGREINQQRFVLGFGFGECGVDIFLPIDEHGVTFLLKMSRSL